MSILILAMISTTQEHK
ncbi:MULTISPECIES: hypothetical protein [Bacteria]|nr:hypothetical protein [Enterobacter sp. Bisph1]